MQEDGIADTKRTTNLATFGLFEALYDPMPISEMHFRDAL
jgi:hypothetical protein